MKLQKAYGTLAAVVLALSACQETHQNSGTTWDTYLGGLDRNHYSTLNEITPENVSQLQIAWQYATPDSGQMQTNPIIIGNTLYGVSPSLSAFAIDATTGTHKWSFRDTTQKWNHVNRGVTFWKEGKEERILMPIGHHLYAIDAHTGQLVASFGENGRLDLREGLPAIAKEKYVIATTPPTLFKNLIYLSVRLSEDTDAAPGDIRAFDVKTGKLVWTFHTIPHPGEEGYDSFPENAYLNTETGAANNWSGMTIDEKRGILFVPTGSVSYDFYGGNRPGNNLYGNSLLALDAYTGKKLWHYQFIHHDLWDRDLPAPPNLLTVTHNGKKIDAVAQVTKHGYVFVFNRETGEPLFPIDEVPVPTTPQLPGEWVSPTQPIPRLPAPYARQGDAITADDISVHAPNRAELIKTFSKIDKRQFAPPSQTGTLIFPGFDGGAEWGGAAADAKRGILYVNSNEMPWILTMVEPPKETQLAHLSPGERIYTLNCATCHQPDRSGNPASGYPSLTQLSHLSKADAAAIIKGGKGMMPGFTQLKTEEREALIAFLYNEEKTEATGKVKFVKKQMPYKSTGYHKFLDSNGLPAIGPPWGTLNAIDLNTGEYLWKIPLGEVDSLMKAGHAPTGTENYGGPLITENGLLVIGATTDSKLRIFDRHTGKLLWQTQLPAPAFATPATYQVNGKQYIVIACGGTKLGTKKGNQYVAFALP